MKGKLHDRLRAQLARATREGICTQESLGKAMGGKSQRSAGQYLNDEAGALDLDEADAALEHIGSSLQAFLANLPPRELTTTERLARALLTRPMLAALIEDLLPVPPRRLSDVVELARGLGRVATPRGGARKAGSTSGRRQARRTTKASTPRR